MVARVRSGPLTVHCDLLEDRPMIRATVSIYGRVNMTHHDSRSSEIQGNGDWFDSSIILSLGDEINEK